MIALHAILFCLIATSAPSGSLDVQQSEVPDPDELAILDELAEWVGEGSDTDRVSFGRRLGETIRDRPSSFELFRAYHDESDRRERLTELPFGQLIARAAERYGVDGLLLAALVQVESGFDPEAVSNKGAVGLMQVLPTTAGLSVEQLMDPVRNLDAGTAYLAHLLALYRGDLELALAGYNAGPGAVRRFDGLPPYRETRAYVERVLSIYVQHHRDHWQSSESGEMLALLF